MTTDANTGVDSSTAPITDDNSDAASSDALGEVVLDPEHFDPDSDNLISTVDDDIGGIDVTTGGSKDKPAEEPPAEPEAAAKEEEPDTDADVTPEPYHKDPAWQRIIKERDAAKLELQKLKSSSADELAPAEKPQAELSTGEFNKISKMPDEELLEWMSDNPKEYSQYLVQVAKAEAKAEFEAEISQKQMESKVDATYDAYAEQNPSNEDKTGFVEMWESGSIQEYIDKNPGHNPISAHMAMTVEARVQREIAEATAKTKAKIEAKYKKNQEARKITDGLTGGPGYVPADENDGLANTKKHGGLATTLAQRLAAKRQQAV